LIEEVREEYGEIKDPSKRPRFQASRCELQEAGSK